MSDYESSEQTDNFSKRRRKAVLHVLVGNFFGVQVDRVQEVLRPQPITRVPMAPAGAGRLLNLREQL